MNLKAAINSKVLRRALLSAPLGFALAALSWGGVPKTSGTTEISDDLVTGGAGSVELSGGGKLLSGSLGQVAASTAGAAGVELESGYFSKLPANPYAIVHSQVFASSASVSGTGGDPNPSGTVYFVETSSLPSFGGAVITSATAFWPESLQGLKGNTTYYTRLRAAYMSEDFTDYSPAASFQTLPATPTPQGFAAVFSSSLTVAWDGEANSPGTLHFVQLGADPGFLTGGFANVTGSSHTFTGLSPNATYYVRLKAIGDLGDETPYSLFGATITAAVTPSAASLCGVSSVTVAACWNASGNPAGTRYLLQYSTDGFATVQGSSLTVDVTAAFSGLTPNVTHYLRVAALNAAGTAGLAAALPATATSAAPPLALAESFSAVGAFSVSAQWLANGNPPDTEYLAQASTAPAFGGAFTAGPGWSAGVAIIAAGLEPVTTYYFRAKARNAAGAETSWTQLGATVTLAGADTFDPVITNNQAGDMNWRSANSALYNVDLADSGGSYLDRLQVRATTGAAGTGTLVFDWTDAVTNIDANSYTADWGLTSAQWALLPSGTSYVSVRAYDGVGNYADAPDAFYILKDTAAPTIQDLQGGETVWRKTDPGAVYAVNFYDAAGGSGLYAAEYSAASAPGTAGADVLAWTQLPGLTPGATFYEGPWALNFGALASGVTNYISVRALDGAGNFVSVTDAFLVLKNTSGPEVRLTAPSAGFHSALAAVAGTAAPNLEYPIAGSEITIQHLGSNNYWDGADFISATPVWLQASGTNAWTYDTSGIAWTAGIAYQVVARSSDTAQNFSVPYATATFTYDASVPTAFITVPAADATVETPAVISGTAADTGPNSGVPYVGLTLRRAADLKWWNFFTGAWVNSPVSTMTAGGANWNFYPDGPLRGALQHNVTYYVYAVPRDGAVPANEPPAGIYATTFTVRDTAAPGAITFSSAAMGALPGRLLASWTAPGDDGALGSLSDNSWFAINYSTWAGAAFSTAAAMNQVAISTAGVVPGSTQYHLLSGLTPGVTYYLKIWASDEAGNWSGASPLASGRAAPSLADSIAGNVYTAAGAGVTGVLVEAIDRNLAVVKTAYTVDDGSGSFTLAGLGEGIYRVEATWLSDGFASSVASDQIPTGYAEVLFTLSVDVELASVGGELAAYRLSALGSRPLAAGSAAVELYQGSRLVAVAPVGAGGRFLISNLLPGRYSLKVPDGAGGAKLLQVTLAPGQNLRLSPLGELLRSDKVYAYPNPARRSVTFHLESDQSPVLKQLTVFDLTGRPIKEFSDGEFTTAGNVSEVTWNIPSGVASGVYMYSARVKYEPTGEYRKTVKKFAIVR
ncbi:MAG: T9SS type A sorting domain-containing protein [Elusimicrobiales bacterium]|nr:T9SS type A sorting domain-containing protein [Elusimicrobiales bacterium]